MALFKKVLGLRRSKQEVTHVGPIVKNDGNLPCIQASSPHNYICNLGRIASNTLRKH